MPRGTFRTRHHGTATATIISAPELYRCLCRCQCLCLCQPRARPHASGRPCAFDPPRVCVCVSRFDRPRPLTHTMPLNRPVPVTVTVAAPVPLKGPCPCLTACRCTSPGRPSLGHHRGKQSTQRHRFHGHQTRQNPCNLQLQTSVAPPHASAAHNARGSHSPAAHAAPFCAISLSKMVAKYRLSPFPR